MHGARIGMECKAGFAANIWILARKPTLQTARVRVIVRCGGLMQHFPEALNESPQMHGTRIGMGCKAGFAANIWILARKPTLQTARVRVIVRCGGLMQRFPKTAGRITYRKTPAIRAPHAPQTC